MYMWKECELCIRVCMCIGRVNCVHVYRKGYEL